MLISQTTIPLHPICVPHAFILVEVVVVFICVIALCVCILNSKVSLRSIQSIKRELMREWALVRLGL